MDEKENKDIQNRREFFKQAARLAIPMREHIQFEF